MSIYTYINKDGDRKIGKPEHKEMYAKIGYSPENKDVDNDGLQDGTNELEAARDECKARGIKFDGRNGLDKLNSLIEADKAE